MPIIYWLLGALGRGIYSFLGLALQYLGFVGVTSLGMDVLILVAEEGLQEYLAGIPTVAIQILGLAQIDAALSLVISAHGFVWVRNAFGGPTGGGMPTSKKTIRGKMSRA